MANFFTDNDDLRFYVEQRHRLGAAGARHRDGLPQPRRPQERRRGARRSTRRRSRWSAASSPTRSRRTPPQLDREGVRLEGGEAVFPPRLAGIFEQIKRARAARPVRAARARRHERAAAALLPGRPRCSRAPTSRSWRTTAFTAAWPWRCCCSRVREGTTKIDPRHGRDRRDALRRLHRGDRARRGLGLHGHHRARRRQRHGAAARRAASRTPTATGSSPGRRSSSPRATASTTSSSRAPRRSRTPTIRSRGLGGPVDVPGADLRGRARRQRKRIVEHRAHRGEARPPRVGDGAARLRARAGDARRQARRGLQVHADAHEQRAPRRRLRVHRAAARRRMRAGGGLRGRAQVDGQDDRPARDDRRLPRRDAHRHRRRCARWRCTARSTRSWRRRSC